MHIQVKDGWVNVCDATVLLRLPVKEVFRAGPQEDDEILIEPNEELYFDAADWKKSGMYKAVYIERDGLLFTGKDKKLKLLGGILAKENLDFPYPNITSVFPDENSREALPQIGVNAKCLYDLSRAWGNELDCLQLAFNGRSRAIIVTHLVEPGYGLIMPFLGEFPDNNVPEEPESISLEDLL